METRMTVVTWCVVGIVVAPFLVCCSAAPTPKVKGLSGSNDSSPNDKKMKQESPIYPLPSSSSSSSFSSHSSLSNGQIKQAKSPVSFGQSPHPASRDRVKSAPKTTPEKPKGKGAAEDGREQGGMGPGGSPAPRGKSLGTVDDDGLRYLLFGEDGRWKQQKQVTFGGSPFSTSVPPLAMAEYLLLTGDFSGFDGALEDIIAVGMMTSAEAEIYRLQVGAEYQSLIKQETEAEMANMYGDYRKVAPTYPEGGTIDNYRLGSFIPPFAIEYSDYGYYDNPTNDVMFGRESEFMTDEVPKLPPSDYIDEILQQVIDSIDEGQNGDRHGPMNSSGSSTPTSASSSPSTASPPQTQQQQQQQQQTGRQNSGKAGKGGGKSDAGKGSARKAGTKEKGRKGGAGKGGGRGGGGGGGKVSSSSSSSTVESVSDVESIRPTPDTMNRELEMLTKTQNKTKEANGTKTRRPLSKQ